jgi:hypothetical protein
VLGYTAHDVDDLTVSDFLALCDALERYAARENAEIEAMKEVGS